MHHDKLGSLIYLGFSLVKVTCHQSNQGQPDVTNAPNCTIVPSLIEAKRDAEHRRNTNEGAI